MRKRRIRLLCEEQLQQEPAVFCDQRTTHTVVDASGKRKDVCARHVQGREATAVPIAIDRSP